MTKAQQQRSGSRAWWSRGAAALAAAMAAVTPAAAQLPIPASTQFDVTGFVQEATLDPSCAADAHCGGTVRVNGHVITIPKETVVILPANALTWQELFAQAPAPYGLATTPPTTGMALSDLPAPLTTYEIQVIGNRVLGATPNEYIAGLVHLSQQDLNSGAGFINFMDYTTGEMRVGGLIGDPTTGTRVRINDPVVAALGTGRYSRGQTPDGRFMVDQDNPTIAAGTGFPMCFPRAAPSGVVGAPETDPLCPQANRPGGSIINMADPALNVSPNPHLQVPFQVGDYVTFAGTLVTDRAQPTVGPMPNPATEPGVGTYVSAHTITSNVAVYTFPGTNPAYVTVEVALIGTGGLTVIGAGEAVIRTRFEGMTTDPTRNIHLYGIDLNALDGSTSDRDWGTIGVDPGPPTGAVKGRWRFRPPCLVFGTVPTKPDKECVMNSSGVFLPPTREMRAVIEGQQGQVPGTPGASTAANGIFYGQYHAPIGEYIFPENIPGTPIVENNFNTIAFLAQGGYTSSAGTLVGQLDPWPSNVRPTPACTPPVANAGGPYTVASAGTVALAGSATGTTPITFAWAAPAAGTISDPTVAGPIYAALPAAGTVALSLTATNACGTSTAASSVTVNQAAAPTVNQVAPVTVLAGANLVTIPISGTDPGGLALTFTVTQAGAPALIGLQVVPTGATTANVTFTAPQLPLGQVTSAVVTLTITARNAGGTSSAPSTTSVTVKPVPDAVVVTNVTYRTSKQRLVITATSSVVSPNVSLTLRPYQILNGTTFDPTALGATFTNGGGGLYTLTLVGAPQPLGPPALPIVVQSNLGGVSAAHGVDLVRP